MCGCRRPERPYVRDPGAFQGQQASGSHWILSHGQKGARAVGVSHYVLLGLSQVFSCSPLNATILYSVACVCSHLIRITEISNGNL